jgi:hypothetical protein
MKSFFKSENKLIIPILNNYEQTEEIQRIVVVSYWTPKSIQGTFNS